MRRKVLNVDDCQPDETVSPLEGVLATGFVLVVEDGEVVLVRVVYVPMRATGGPPLLC